MSTSSSPKRPRSVTPSTDDEHVINDADRPTRSHRDDSENNILERLRNLESHGIAYLGDKDIAAKTAFFFNKDINGDVLIRKDSSTTSHPTELLLAGIFEIDARNFFMSSDAKYNSSSNTLSRFDQIKLQCHLIPVRHSDFVQSFKVFPSVVTNIQTIEKTATGRRGHDDISILTGSYASPTGIKLVHQLFKVCKLFFVKYYFILFCT
jgi:hypothetical protein